MDQVPGRERTPLAGVEDHALQPQLHREVEVRVVADDQRRLAAQLEDEALQGRRRLRRDRGADGIRPREGHQVHAGVRGEEVTDGRATGDDVDDAGRKVRLGDGLGDGERGQRRVRRGLQHDGVPGAERRPELHDVEEEREVVGGDRGDHADRLPPDHPAPEPPAAVAALRHARRRRHELGARRDVGPVRQLLERETDLVARGGRPGRAHLGDDEIGELRLAPGERLVQPPEVRRPLDAGHPPPRPVVDRSAGRADGGVHVGVAALGHPGEERLGGRVHDLVGTLAGSRTPTAVDEEIGAHLHLLIVA